MTGIVPSTAATTGSATSANQVAEIASLASILAKIIVAPATEAKQDVIITALNSIDAGTAAALGQALMALSVPVTIASNQSAVPISGTVTVDTSLLATQATLAAVLAKIIAAPSTEAKQDTGNTSLATIAAKDFATQTTLASVLAKIIAAPATEAKQDTGNTSLSSIDTKTPALGQALAAASTPVVLTAAQVTTLTPPAAISGFNLEATQLLIKAKTDNIPAQGQALAAASLPVVLTAAQVTTLTPQTNSLTDTQLRATPVPISGTVATGGLTDTQLRASAVPVSNASLPLPTGASTSALQGTGNTSLSNIDTKIPSQGQALAAASLPVVLTAAQVSTLTPPAAISGFNLEATQLLIKAKTDNIPALGQALAAASTPVVLTAAQVSTLTPQTNSLTDAQLRATAVPTKEVRSVTPSQSSLSVTNANTSILASNSNRLGATIYNEGAAICYMKLGGTAAITSYTLQIASGGYYEVPYNYTGAIEGITSSGTAQLRVTEVAA